MAMHPGSVEGLTSTVEEKQAALKIRFGAAIMDVRSPELPSDQHDFVVNQLEKFSSHLVSQGYSLEPIAAAAMNVWGQIVELVDKDNLLATALLKKEGQRRLAEFRRERLRQAANGERCTEESIDILLQAETEGFELTIENDGTFALVKHGTTYLRSNADIERFGRLNQKQREEEEAKRSPLERLVEQGHEHLQAQRLESAISSYSAALRIKPDDAELHFHRGIAWSNAYYNRGNKAENLQKAIEDFGQAIEIDHEYAAAYYHRAESYSAQGQVEGAISDYSKAIECGYMVADSHYSRAMRWRQLIITGEDATRKAIEDLDIVVRVGDKNDQYMALMARGEVHLDLGNLDLAVADLTAATAYYPRSPPGLYRKRAASFQRLGRTREAVADLDRAIAAVTPLAAPGLIADIHDQRGECRAQLGEAHLAREDFDRARQLRQQNR
jgi:tetratricopeptide (TPR) repeat protein